MCYLKEPGYNKPFTFTIRSLCCDKCGCVEGWKEIGKTYKFVCRGHETIPNYGVVDDCIMLEHTAWCPGCKDPVDSHYIDCQRMAVVAAEVSVPMEVDVNG